jgi:hypothetical protein
MITTTIAALLWQAFTPSGFFFGPKPNMFLGISCLVLIGLAVFVGGEGIKVLMTRKTAQEFFVEAEEA